MGGPTSIEWTEHRWNPIVGCSVLSPGCTNCYAMGMAARIEAMNAALRPGHGEATHYAGTTRKVNGKAVWTGKLALAGDDVLLAPLKRKKPTTYFVNSMGDLFHEDCPDAWIDRVFAVMALCPHHTFQVLTKRAARMWEYLTAGRAESVGLAMLTIVDRIPYGHRQLPWPLSNVWLGVSTEDQKRADERIPELLATPAAVRFISAEPLLGGLDLTNIGSATSTSARLGINALTGDSGRPGRIVAPRCWPKLDWVIVGGESGPDARPMHPDWARALRDQCAAAGVSFFFKQWGAWAPQHPKWSRAESHAVANDGTNYRSADIAYPNGRRYGEAIRAGHDKAHLTSMYRVGKKAAGRLLDGVEHSALPEARA